jgi:inorganic pyrophosphatase
MEDEKGGYCKVLLIVICNDPRFFEASYLNQVAPHIYQDIKHFLETYKTLKQGSGSESRVGAARQQLYLKSSALIKSTSKP